MYCRKCGAEIPDDSVFCMKCGTPVESLAAQPQKQEQITVNSSETSVPHISAYKKKRTGLVIACAALGLVLVLAGLYFFVLKGKNRNSVSNTPDAVQMQVSILEDKEKLAEITASVLKLECYDDEGELYATGSGFVAINSNLIVTNYHVIEDHPYEIKALSENGGKFDVAEIVTCNIEMDIAILKTKDNMNLVPLSFADNLVEKTDKVVAIGSPLGLMNTVSEGIVSGFTQVGNESVIQFTASISHGSSGGVLLNEAGEVVGVTFASFAEGQNLNVAIPIAYVSTLYSREGNKQTKTILAFYNEVDHTKTYSVVEVKSNPSAHQNEEMFVCGYMCIFNDYYSKYRYSYYIANDSHLYDELVKIREKQFELWDSRDNKADGWTLDWMSINDTYHSLLASDEVIKLNLDSYKMPTKISSGSCVIAHGKLDSDGFLVVDSVDFYD